MDNVLCKYHQNPAIWHCPDCNTYFCPHCVPGSTANYHRNKPRCLLCQGFLQFEGGAHTAEPFWNLSSKFFSYPFHKNSLIALSSVFVMLILISAMPFTGILLLLLFAGTFRYSLLILDGCTDGDFSSPNPSLLFSGDEDHLFMKFIGIMVCYFISMKLLADASPTLAMGFGFFIPFLIPANMILLATEKQILPAINPLGILSLIVSMGAPYFLMGLLVQIVGNAPYYLIILLGKHLPSWLMLPLFGTISVYFSFVTCAMMGYTVYQHQKELGYSSSNDDEYYLEPAVFEKKKSLATIKILVQEVRYKEARALLLSALQNDHDNMELNDILHRLLIVTNDLETLKTHTLNCVEFFARKGYTGKAAVYYLDTLQKITQFQLDKPDISTKVAQALFEQGKHKEALLLLKNLHKRFPDYGLIFPAYFLAAKIYAEGLHDMASANRMLDFLETHFSKNSLLPELVAYRKNLI